jgi:hypothetical protein
VPKGRVQTSAFMDGEKTHVTALAERSAGAVPFGIDPYNL